MIEPSETLQVNEKHGLLFAIYSGLSVSEWMDSEMPHMFKTASKVFSNGSNSDPK